MTNYTFSSQDLARDLSAAQRATVATPSLLDVMIGLPNDASIDFQPPHLHLRIEGASFDEG
ncbi:MAG: hypothetical protein QM533_05305 [Cytophagales bacterium]|nr:hypothetical protein [Cytophagales bacterium]